MPIPLFPMLSFSIVSLWVSLGRRPHHLSTWVWVDVYLFVLLIFLQRSSLQTWSQLRLQACINFRHSRWLTPYFYPYFVCVVVFLQPSGVLYMVSEQFNFSGVGLLAPCPPPATLEDRWFFVGVVSLSWPVPILKRQELAFRPYMT